MRIFREYKLLAAVLVELIVVLALHFSGSSGSRVR